MFGKMHVYRGKKWEKKHIKQFCSYDRANNNWRHGCGALNILLPFDISHMDFFFPPFHALICVSFPFIFLPTFTEPVSEYSAVCVRGILVLMQVQPWRW